MDEYRQQLERLRTLRDNHNRIQRLLDANRNTDAFSTCPVCGAEWRATMVSLADQLSRHNLQAMARPFLERLQAMEPNPERDELLLAYKAF